MSGPGDRLLFWHLTPLNARRWRNFKRNRRGYWSMWIFAILFGISLFAELVANDKPLLVKFEGELLFPVFVSYPETRFGGFFETETDYRDRDRTLQQEGHTLTCCERWRKWTLNRFNQATVRMVPNTMNNGRKVIAVCSVVGVIWELGSRPATS